METIHITVFGSNREAVSEAVSRIRSLCERKGVEYVGPITYPNLDLEKKDQNLADERVELFGEPPSEQEIDLLSDELIFSRKFKIHRYASDEVVKEVAKETYPESVFLRIDIQKTEFQDSRGHEPFSFDPNQDYSTEL